MAAQRFVRLLAVAAVAATGIGTAAVAHAEPAAAQVITADLDRDRRDDRISIVATSGGYQLQAELASGGTRIAALPDDDGIPRRGLRATDVNSDGFAEVVTPVFVGMFSTSFTLYVLDRDSALAPLRAPDGQPFEVTEGGGSVMVNGWDCAEDHDGRSLSTVKATAHDGPDDQPRYDGNRVTYAVADGIVTPIYDSPFTEVLRTDPVLMYDPSTCAPTP